MEFRVLSTCFFTEFHIFLLIKFVLLTNFKKMISWFKICLNFKTLNLGYLKARGMHMRDMYITEKVLELYQRCDIHTFPVDCIDILHKLDCRVYSFSYLKKHHSKLYTY